MTQLSKYPSSRVHVGQEFSIVSTTDKFVGAQDDSFLMGLSCTALIVHYYLISGTNVTLEFYTGAKERERLVDSIVLGIPSSSLNVLRLEELAGNIRCRVVTTGAAQLEVRIMGAHSNKSDSTSTSPNDSALVVTNPTITNTTLAFANTESAIVLPANTKRFILQARGNSQLKVAYVLGQSGVTNWTVHPGGSLIETDINRASTTLYVQSSKAGEVVEVRSWS